MSLTIKSDFTHNKSLVGLYINNIHVYPETKQNDFY